MPLAPLAVEYGEVSVEEHPAPGQPVEHVGGNRRSIGQLGEVRDRDGLVDPKSGNGNHEYHEFGRAPEEFLTNLTGEYMNRCNHPNIRGIREIRGFFLLTSWISLLNKHSRSGIFVPGGFDHLKKLLFGNFLS